MLSMSFDSHVGDVLRPLIQTLAIRAGADPQDAVVLIGVILDLLTIHSHPALLQQQLLDLSCHLRKAI